MKYTPLYEEHVKLGAKMVDFAGFNMPIQYTSIKDEVLAVRKNVGMFDVSHMGEVIVEGKDSTKFVDFLITNDFKNLKPGEIVYTAMCNENGGFVDDLLAYKISEEKAMLVINASNIEKDFSWMKKISESFDVTLENKSDEYVLIAVQGPNAQKTLQKITNVDLEQIGYYTFTEGNVLDIKAIISRTGYTGEDGFEIYTTDKDGIIKIWKKLLNLNVIPAGLGARDCLRLEASLLLYGNDMDETITPLEVGIKWAVKFEKDFMGKEALKRQLEEGTSRRLKGFKIIDKGIARHGYKVFKDGKEIGYVTSGTFSPTLNQAIGMALIEKGYKSGEIIEIEIRNKLVKAEIVKMPFYRGSVKSKKKG
ncbi:glycine cleavage system protein T [Thermosipho melanesiensis]|uniref:Aminomethyltransferase n=2 Tax=Thermosipho melanesiensis TaxID=46541 RepID=GCST_THEM4|nr:glycine cleavage system aminomethyltransferase GcvT [Thermosipho melanesiensis]A6LP67.1 RecName: Full=Aminomethyltransferase; AltName: Full=Glycine cleavage system T protein [Thermosipho melanesiensis BI429]ABR31718.1 glycine cleavage system T protein [Thermosipho melanesiensis BI429]APT74740.1 glycine cleavage system protein T [Thermosipho melanesiensis]OOC35243.1 glycine cleavage system protein T [Thermosipho melanesiensis]OOC35453.1 glycine cleavage system protein T [Thermosipho melanesi